MQSFDVIIVGGGLMGLSLAARLAETELTIALVDRAAIVKQFDPSAFDNRVFAITRQSENFFRDLGVWDDIEAKRLSPYRQMQVWDAQGNGHIEFDARDVAQANLGHIIENSVLQSSLSEQIAKRRNTHLFEQAEPKKIEQAPDHIELHLSETVLSGKVLLAADGANSWVRDHLAMPIHSWDYAQFGIVATVVTEQPHNATARQRFMPNGPLAFLPLSEPNTCSIVWSTETEHAKSLMALDDAAFQSALTEAFDHTLGAVTQVSQRFSFPLKMRHAKQYVGHRVALVGDAAHTIHPLAGQGANLGLSDVMALADCISSTHRAGKDIGARHRLRRYERARKGENWLLVAGMESFKQGFGKQHPWLKWARNTSLNAVDRFSPIKRRLMRRAMGIL